MKRRHKDMTLTWIILYFLIALASMSFTIGICKTLFPDLAGAYERPIDPSPEVVYVSEPIAEKSKAVIRLFFGSHGEEAVEVARCESGWNPAMKNKHSSAKGLFQIIDGTWRQFKCDGDVLNAVDNARCAKKIYDHTKSWNTSGGWEASAHCHKQK